MNSKKIGDIMDELEKASKSVSEKIKDAGDNVKDEVHKRLSKAKDDHKGLSEKIQKISEVAGDTASELKAAATMGINADSKEDLTNILHMAGKNIRDSYHEIADILS